MIVVYSIFAAIAGGLLVFVLQDPNKALCENWKWPVLLFAFSFFLFSLTAERVAESVSEQNIQKRIAYMLLYNFGVILLFFGGALTIGDFSLPGIFSKLLLYIPLKLQFFWWLIMILGVLVTIIRWQKAWWLIIFFTFVVFILCPKHTWWLPAVLLSVPWVDDVIWLIFSNNDELKKYFKIVGNITPSSDERIWVKIFYNLRHIVNCLRELYKGHKMNLPHDDVYTRLQCSPIHGVGVFAIRDVPKGTNIF
jgi:hypothetical protein